MSTFDARAQLCALKPLRVAGWESPRRLRGTNSYPPRRPQPEFAAPFAPVLTLIFSCVRARVQWIRCFRFRPTQRSEEHTSELQSQSNLVCRLLLEKKKTNIIHTTFIRLHTLQTRGRNIFLGVAEFDSPQ